MRIPGVKTAKAFSRWARARIFGGALILGYHRVAEAQNDGYEVCVAPQHFADQMAALSRVARPISLRELVRCLKAGSVPPAAVAVTFDDGYADNLYTAKPILEKYGIPATVFVCTGYAGREFWWDELERLVLSSTAELSALRLEMEQKLTVENQADAAGEADPVVRRRFCRALYRFLLNLDIDEQAESMNQIRDWAEVSSSATSSIRSMTHAELLELADGGLIELGAHTRDHPMLPRLSPERQRAEIAGSKHDLEDLLGKKVHGFAYPNGTSTDDAKRIVRETGFVYACTSQHDVVRPASDLHELTRFWQKNVGGDQFLKSLSLWMRLREV